MHRSNQRDDHEELAGQKDPRESEAGGRSDEPAQRQQRNQRLGGQPAARTERLAQRGKYDDDEEPCGQHQRDRTRECRCVDEIETGAQRQVGELDRVEETR